MKTCSVASFVVALCSVLIVAAVRADLPVTNQVVKYERCDSEGKWREVQKSDGEVVLACLRNIESFKTWGSTVPPGILAHPIPTPLNFRVMSVHGTTNLIYFSTCGELVSPSGGRLLVVPDDDRRALSELFARWRAVDKARIVSQPLPCQYRIGSLDDGGTLSGIARLFYGDSSKWRAIHEANRAIIPDPNAIRDGVVITIPKPTTASN